jgi:adenylylsulfate kinase
VTEIRATNITWHEGHVSREERETLLEQKGVLIWMTGLSGSGKSTVAYTLEHALVQRGHLAYVLDGDNVRHGLNKNLGFSAEDREENIRRIGEVAKLFADTGVITITAFISPYRKDRDNNRELLGEGNFVEVYCKAPLEVCEDRDPKGLYKKARAGELKGFTGIDDPYEEPLNPEMVIQTDQTSPQEATVALIERLEAMGKIPQLKE